MKLNEIRREDVLEGKCWLLLPGQDGESNPDVRESIGFTSEDTGLFEVGVKFVGILPPNFKELVMKYFTDSEPEPA